MLLVDDNRLYSIAVRSLLESRFRSSVIHCGTFAGLRRELADGAFDLVILDPCLADAPDGKALDYILSCDIPLIVFSGYSSEKRRAGISERGVADLVYKNSPHSLEDLAHAIERVLSADPPNVLVIDPVAAEDSEILRLVATDAFSTVHCETGTDALALLDRTKGAIELVVVYADLAGENDHALLRTLSLGFGEDAVGVVGFTGKPAVNGVSRFLGAGGDDFLALPMSAADVEGRLMHTLAVHRRIRSLQRTASRDYLTDMLNRRYFFDRGPRLVEMCLRRSAPVCAALLDIDHFKRLNDTYGHEIGDLVLKSVSRKLLQIVGEKQHLPARIGGEEFALLLTNMDIGQAYQFCERIRTDIAATKIVVDDEDLSVTVSMGLAHISDSEAFDNYLNAADHHLYLAKHAGRDRVFPDCQSQRIAAS
ncbi:MAG: diguanylate cyclase [Rhizobiaceae bacterium]|nr:diguanylate cyclase [Rhizobiaceae bacterium]